MLKETLDVESYAAFLIAAERSFGGATRHISPEAGFLRRVLRDVFGLSKSRKPWREVLKAEVDALATRKGVILEFGVHKGYSTNFLASLLPQATIHGFDSFAGFPKDGRGDWQQDFSVPTLPIVPGNVVLHQGFFDETLPDFVKKNADSIYGNILLIHVDCDIYSSTVTILNHIGPFLKPGSVLVFDELVNYEGFFFNEMLALYEFLTDNGLDANWSTVVGRIWPASTERMPSRRFGEYREDGFCQNQSIRLCEENCGGFRDVATSLRGSGELVDFLAAELQQALNNRMKTGI